MTAFLDRLAALSFSRWIALSLAVSVVLGGVIIAAPSDVVDGLALLVLIGWLYLTLAVVNLRQLRALGEQRAALNAQLRAQEEAHQQALQAAETRLAQSLQSGQTDRQRLFESLDRRIDTVDRRITQERSERIAGFARRDSPGRLPERLLVLLTVHRSGSTWLMDMLRCNPGIYLDPGALVYEALDLTIGGRYPAGLSDGPDATMDFENSPGHGSKIPAFPPLDVNLPVAVAQPYALEKLHPQFLNDDADDLLRRVEALEREHGTQVRFVYQVRDPKAVFSSFINFQQRTPSWYRGVTQDKLPGFMENAYHMIDAFARLRPGVIVDYRPLKADPVGTLTGLYAHLWPDEDTDLLRQAATAAVEHTQREKRLATGGASGFLGQQEGPVKGEGLDDTAFFEQYTAQIDRVYAAYHALLDQQNSSTGGKSTQRTQGNSGEDQA